jgi:hypothetical protein
MIALPGEAVGSLAVVEDGFFQITLAGIGLAQVVLQHRSQKWIAAKRESPVVCAYGQAVQTGLAADIAQPFHLINILELKRKFTAGILVDPALFGAVKQSAHQIRAASFDGLIADFLQAIASFRK